MNVDEVTSINRWYYKNAQNIMKGSFDVTIKVSGMYTYVQSYVYVYVYVYIYIYIWYVFIIVTIPKYDMKVSDAGGGMKREQLQKIWKYGSRYEI